ncbi:MAG: glycosyltransferase [Nanoarchaeota archaeon]
MNLAYSLIVSLVWFLSIYFNVVFLLALLSQKEELFKSPKLKNNQGLPKVSIIVPAYNEEDTIEQNITSLNRIDYPKDRLEIIIVNDGSRDNTSKIINRLKGKNIIFIDNKNNKGKAACLNQGIEQSSGEFVACMDADSEVQSDILKKTVPYFSNKKIGAVTVTVEVKDAKNFLQKIIAVEYIIGLSLFLKVLSYFGAVHVTPGPFSIYRKKVLENIGRFDPKSTVEDLEIAYRLQKGGYKIACCIATKVRTITPGTFKSLYKQRKRWYSGAIYTIIKHHNVVFNSEIGYFSYIVPYTFLLILLGLSLFAFSVYLGLSNLIKSISFFSLTNFNFLSYITLKKFDVLTMGTLSFFGITAIATTILSMYICMKLSNTKIKKNILGVIGFPFIFFLYQIFWASSILAVIFRKKVGWK